MAVRNDRGDVKQTTTRFLGPLMAQSLASAKSKFLSLDLEGSMSESVAFSFRQFNTRQKLMFNISKTNSRLLKLRGSLFDIMY